MQSDDGLLKSEGNNIPFGDLVFGDKIGAGNFGKVNALLRLASSSPLTVTHILIQLLLPQQPTPTHTQHPNINSLSTHPRTTQVYKGEYFGTEVGE